MISWYHLVAWRNLGPRIRLVAVCDPNEVQPRRPAGEFGIARVFHDRETRLASETMDALDVVSPRHTHAAFGEAAAAKGIYVICQKAAHSNPPGGRANRAHSR
jgi:predicted dehydrogenase